MVKNVSESHVESDLVSPEKCFVLLLVFGGPKSAEIPNIGKSAISPNSACPPNPEIHIFEKKKRLRHVPQTENSF